MYSQRLGCLSPLALFTAALTLIALIGAGIVSGSSMFSPGALNAQAGEPLGGVRSHAETGKDCAKCHTAPWTGETMAGRCFACHSEIQQDIGDASTLHGAFLAQNIAYTCYDCHTEHTGPAGELTLFDPASFPHATTGFDLAGHAFLEENIPFNCTDCHTASLARFEPQVCTECHRSLDAAYTAAHLLDFGEDCLACHDGLDRYGDFDHNRTDFALSGAHQEASCSGCHGNARALADLQNTPATCEACHLDKDAHAGKFGMQCGACHSSPAWKPATFDHSLSAFPLDGAHTQAACEDCHTGGQYQGTPAECSACHADPAFHAGMFSGQACSACHSTAAWRPGRYTGPHTFPIDHGEQNNACADCHRSGDGTPNLTQWTCYSCHERGEVEQEHREEGISDFNDCLRCHADGREEGD